MQNFKSITSSKGDKEAQNILVEENIGLVWSIVKRFKGRNTEVEDIFQIGCIFVKAIKSLILALKLDFQHSINIISKLNDFRDDGSIGK